MRSRRTVHMKTDITPDLKQPCMPLYPALAGGSVKGFEARTKSQLGVVHKLNARSRKRLLGLYSAGR